MFIPTLLSAFDQAVGDDDQQDGDSEGQDDYHHNSNCVVALAFLLIELTFLGKLIIFGDSAAERHAAGLSFKAVLISFTAAVVKAVTETLVWIVIPFGLTAGTGSCYWRLHTASFRHVRRDSPQFNKIIIPFVAFLFI